MGAKLEQAAIAGSVALARMTEELLNHSPQFFVCFQGLALLIWPIAAAFAAFESNQHRL
jgi:hypothetical protein